MAAKKTASAQPTVAEVLSAMNRIAPPELAESWDNVGLQTGHPARPAGSIMVALEVTRDVIREVRTRRVGTLVTHHPLIFQPLKSMAETRYAPELVTELIRLDCALIAAHTNLDSVAWGTNGVLADLIEMRGGGRRFLFPVAPRATEVKYAVFVPLSHAEQVTEAIARAGAGVIGNYSHCTFQTEGTGTYKPLAGASPFAGTIGKLEQAEEVRIEALCPREKLAGLIQSVRAVHPYEEVAYDVYTLEPQQEPTAGLGIVGELKKKTTLRALALSLKKKLGTASVAIVGKESTAITRAAVCTGAGGHAVRNWREGMGEVLVTGEMTHHECAELLHRGGCAVLVGHHESEAIVAPRVCELLRLALAERGFGDCKIFASKQEKSPVQRL